MARRHFVTRLGPNATAVILLTAAPALNKNFLSVGASLVLMKGMTSKAFLNVALRVMAAVVLFAVTLFCGFGFLASFEYPGINRGHVIYASLGVAFSTIIFCLLRPLFRRPDRVA